MGVQNKIFTLLLILFTFLLSNIMLMKMRLSTIFVFLCWVTFGHGCTWLHNGSCYTMFDEPEEKITQDEANNICKVIADGHLVSITDEEEQTFLVERLKEHFGKTRSTSIWTGGYCDDETGEWRWASDEKFEFTAWADEGHETCQQPNAILMVYLEPDENHQENCNWEWMETDHDTPRRFLCESYSF